LLSLHLVAIMSVPTTERHEMFTITISLEESNEAKPIERVYEDEATAEEMAVFLLGIKTPKGLVVASRVLNSEGEVINEFEY